MKKILWLSRHKMSESQLTDLQRIYGELEVKQIDMTGSHGSQIVEAGSQIVEASNDCDVLAVVLPINIQEQLLKLTDKPVISCKNNRVKTGNLTTSGEVEYKFEFDHWFQIKEVKVVTEKL